MKKAAAAAVKASTYSVMSNYFAVLGIEPTYELDESVLQRAYIAVQQQCHPDRQVGKPESERHAAILRSMDANEAYDVLKSPLGRAQQMLALQGIWVNGEGPDQKKPDQALLMEMMELRESLSEAKDEPEIAKVRQEIQEHMKACDAVLADAFRAGDYERAAQIAMRFRYLGKSLEEAMARQYQLKAAL